MKDNSKFASCGGDRQVMVWDVMTGEISRRFTGHLGKVNAVAFNSDSTILASGIFFLSPNPNRAPPQPQPSHPFRFLRFYRPTQRSSLSTENANPNINRGERFHHLNHPDLHFTHPHFLRRRLPPNLRYPYGSTDI
jgi:WD40 repeat protein